MKKAVLHLLFCLPMGVLFATPTQITTTGTNLVSTQGRQLVRNSLGTIYVVVGTAAGKIQIFGSSNSGANWTEEDPTHEPNSANYKQPSIAVDSTDLIHIAYYDNTVTTGGLRYATFYSTGNTFGIDQVAQAETSGKVATVPGTAIAVDSANKPHVAYVDRVSCCGAATNDSICYTNKVGASWSTRARIDGADTGFNCYYPDILVDNNNLPVFSFFCDNTVLPGPLVETVRGNVNNAASFSTNQMASGATGTRSPSLFMDSANATWVAFANGSNNLSLLKHNAVSGWSTWDAAVSTTNTVAERVASFPYTTTIYNYYAKSSNNNIAFNVYDGGWAGETVTESSAYNRPSAKWSYYVNNTSTSKSDYVIDNGANIFWNQYLISASRNVALFFAGD